MTDAFEIFEDKFADNPCFNHDVVHPVNKDVCLGWAYGDTGADMVNYNSPYYLEHCDSAGQ